MDVCSHRIAESCVHPTMRNFKLPLYPWCLQHFCGGKYYNLFALLSFFFFNSSDVFTITLGAKLYHTVVLIYITLMDNDFDYFSWAFGFFYRSLWINISSKSLPIYFIVFLSQVMSLIF